MMSAAMVFFSLGTQEGVEIAMVNEPSVFEPLNFYCSSDFKDIIMNSVIIRLWYNMSHHIKSLFPHFFLTFYTVLLNKNSTECTVLPV